MNWFSSESGVRWLEDPEALGAEEIERVLAVPDARRG
jgi:hypothetical protein